MRTCFPLTMASMAVIGALVSLSPLMAVEAAGAATGSLFETYYAGMPTPIRGHVLDLAKDCGAVGDGKTLDTPALELCMEKADAWTKANPQKGGVRLVLSSRSDGAAATTYLSAPFNLTSHLTFAIDEGVTLLASSNFSLWPIVAPLASYGQGRDHFGPRRAPFVGGSGLVDIVLTGPGLIDGQGEPWWKAHDEAGEEKYTRGRLIEFLHSDGILFEDLYLQNSPFWTVHPTFSANVVARRLFITNPSTPGVKAPNTDGFDPDSTVNVSLTDSVFHVQDDGVAIKSGWDCFGQEVNRPSANIHIRNLTVSSPTAAGICIGSEMSGGVENVLVEDCHLLEVRFGLRVKSGLGRGAFVRNITYRNVNMDNATSNAIEVNDFYGSRNFMCGFKNLTARPVIDSLVFESIKAGGNGGANFKGLPLIQPLTHISLKDVELSPYAKYDCSAVTGSSEGKLVPSPCDELK